MNAAKIACAKIKAQANKVKVILFCAFQKPCHKIALLSSKVLLIIYYFEKVVVKGLTVKK